MTLRPAAGTGLLLLIVLSWYLYNYGRVALHNEGHPAFSVSERVGVSVMLGECFPDPGIHQFSDGLNLFGVIRMTGLSLNTDSFPRDLVEASIVDGLQVDLRCENGQVIKINKKWMPASQRITLEIPLHPDRMNVGDWEALPGIGPKIAERIENDRQKNGDFETLETLQRVRGIGPKTIERLKKYFL